MRHLFDLELGRLVLFHDSGKMITEILDEQVQLEVSLRNGLVVGQLRVVAADHVLDGLHRRQEVRFQVFFDGRDVLERLFEVSLEADLLPSEVDDLVGEFESLHLDRVGVRPRRGQLDKEGRLLRLQLKQRN